MEALEKRVSIPSSSFASLIKNALSLEATYAHSSKESVGRIILGTYNDQKMETPNTYKCVTILDFFGS